jgi:hypothetical protein
MPRRWVALKAAPQRRVEKKPNVPGRRPVKDHVHCRCSPVEWLLHEPMGLVAFQNFSGQRPKGENL